MKIQWDSVGGSGMVPILYMGNLGLREGKLLVQSHTDFNSGL